MIDKVANVLLNPKFVNFANNTTYTVTTESLFKATGRPVAIMMDNNVDEKTRKYAATKRRSIPTFMSWNIFDNDSIYFPKIWFQTSSKNSKR